MILRTSNQNRLNYNEKPNAFSDVPPIAFIVVRYHREHEECSAVEYLLPNGFYIGKSLKEFILSNYWNVKIFCC